MRRTRATQPPSDRPPSTTSPDAGQQSMLARVAWMYFMEGRRQEDIAQALGLNRMRINRMLTTAREQGIVRIEIDPAIRPCAEIEAQLRSRYDLQRALIVPDAGNDELTMGSIGITLGMFLNETLKDGMTVGTHRGRSCYSLFQGLRSANYPDLSVVSLHGDLTLTGQVLPQEVVARLAFSLGATCHYLAAPTYAASPQQREVFMGLDMVSQVLKRASQCDVAVFAPGALVASQQRILKSLMSDEELGAVLAVGAVGTILGVVVDGEGQAVNHEINARRIGLDLELLRRTPELVMVGQGRARAPIMRIALLAGGVTTLVTDESTAREILSVSSESR